MHAVVNKEKTYMTDWYTVILLAISNASQTIFIKTLTLWTLVGITDLCSNALLAFRTQQEENKRLLRNSTSVCAEISIFLLQSLRRAASTHTRTHQCDSLEEFTSSIALIWRHFWESVRFFFSIPVGKKKWCWITKSDEQKHEWRNSTLQWAAFLPCEWIYPGSPSNRCA